MNNIMQHNHPNISKFSLKNYASKKVTHTLNDLSKINVKNYAYKTTQSFKGATKNVSHKFSSFYFNRDFVNLVLAVYLGTAVQKFFGSITESLLPIILNSLPGINKNEKNAKVKIFGVKVKIGRIIVNLISLSISISVSFIFIYYIILKGKRLEENIKNNIT